MRRRPLPFLVLILAAVVIAVIAGVIDWPLPGAFQRRALAEASSRLGHPVSCESIHWSAFRGVVLRNVRIGSDDTTSVLGPRLRASTIRVLDLLPWEAAHFAVDGPEIRAFRDTAGMLRFPWPELETSDRPERIVVTNASVHFTDLPMEASVELSGGSGIVEPRARRGTLTAFWGDTTPLPVSASWDGSQGRLVLGSFTESWTITHESSGIRIAFRPYDEGAPGLAGEIASDSHDLSLAVKGTLPGPSLDPLLNGTRITGAIDLDAAWATSRGRFTVQSRDGRISGVKAFRALAARPGLARFRNPRYSLVKLAATYTPGRYDIASLVFEGEGLGIRFRGTLTDRRISGHMIALFTEELAAQIPDLRDKTPLLDREGGRIRVAFAVSGSPESPHFEPIPPSTAVVVMRGMGMILRRGFGVVSAPVRGLGRIFSSEE